MIRPVSLENNILCPTCKSNHTLEIYDKRNNPISYDQIQIHGELDRLQNKQLRYFKCKSCNRKFHIDFTEKYPIPLTENKYKEFLKIFQSTK